MLSIISLPLFAISVKYFFGRLRALTRIRSQALANVQSYLHERVSGISIIKSFALEEHEQKIFDKENGEFLEKSLDHTRWNAKSFAVVNTITDIAPLLVIGFASYLIINGQLSVGEMAAFMGYIERLYAPLRRLVNSSTTLTQSIASMDRMFSLMDEEYDVQNKSNALPLPPVSGKVEFKNVEFKYEEEGNPVLKNINFTFNQEKRQRL